MLNVKITFLVLIFCITVLVCNAQIIGGQQTTTTVQTHRIEGQWKIFGGLVNSSIHGHNEDCNLNQDFHVGISYNFVPAHFLKIEPGTRFITKGCVHGDNQVNLSYIDTFLRFKYNTKITNDFHTEPFFGVSGAYMISTTYTVGEKKYNESNAIGNFYEPMDVNFQFGIDLIYQSKYLFGFEYDLGLTQIYKGVDHIYGLKNRSLIFTLGFLF